MNVITVMSDEHSYQMMQFIDKSILKTPNLDRLAAEGVVFDRCYSTCPVCAPARASFFTGRYVGRIGTWDNSTPYDGTVEGISHRLNKHGKRFACIGKTHFYVHGDYGFDYEQYAGYMSRPDVGCYFRGERMGKPEAGKRYQNVSLKTEESYDDRVLEASLQWLEEHHAEQGWHLYVGFLDPHFPFRVKPENWEYYEERIPCVPDVLKPPFTSLNEPLNCLRSYFMCEDLPEETVRRLLIGYCCAVTELDERLGILLDRIDALGIREQTAFLYTSDHGEQLGFHGLWWKCTMFERSAHIPLLMRVPGLAPRRVDAPVDLCDLFPTLCELMEVPPPEGIDGQSLLALARKGTDPARRDFAFSEYHAHGMPDGSFMIFWNHYKYVYYCYAAPQLFQLDSDPQEDHDLLLERPQDPQVRMAEQECHRRLLSVCNPYEVDARAKDYQARMKKALNVSSYGDPTEGWIPYPENTVGAPSRRMPNA
ncbi:MAG: sulfatase-like hydrolase/transferase [Provencibacterium sp.]|jgi:choline-sulfatase|nr:sulfatase-like hydrolase/transferase [Provencibacterium sp.]